MHKSVHKQRKLKARQRRNARCRNIETLYGSAARLQQENVKQERITFRMALQNLFEHLNRGPQRANQKDWEK